MVPTEQKDLNALYENEMRIINSKAPKEENKVNAETKQEDYYKVSPMALLSWMELIQKNFRTNVLLAWTMSNAALAAVILYVHSLRQGLG